MRRCGSIIPPWSRLPKASPALRFAVWERWAATFASGRAAGITAWVMACWPLINGKPMVPDGDNRYHAILGNSGPGLFRQPFQPGAGPVALGAKVRLQGPEGARELEVEKFFVTPASESESEHALKPHEIVTEIVVPAADGMKMAVYEVRQKEALDWPLAAAAVALSMEGDSVRTARVVLGHVAPVPWPSPEAEQALVGKTFIDELADEAGKAAVSKATPLSKNAYKVQLARVAVKRALLRAVKGEA